jgi:hypothetical protein
MSAGYVNFFPNSLKMAMPIYRDQLQPSSIYKPAKASILGELADWNAA